ncbi:MAG: SIMPL domain-containing protein [Bacteroidia bacterium]|nr:SIMPL domain-containing protein [Bacteroidia bacterium]
MKTIYAFLAILMFGLPTLFAQQQSTTKPIIEVTGSAELEITPDEIYVSVTLKEFLIDKKKQSIAGIEKEFKSITSDLKIDNKLISLQSVYGQFEYDYKTNKRGEFLNAKTYLIKFADLEKYNQLVTMLDKKGIENVYIQSTNHSKIEEYRTQVKVEALKAAQQKAAVLLNAISKKVGEVQLIRERDNSMGYQQPMYLKSNVAMAMEASQDTEPIEMRKIKLRYEVEAHFIISN